MKKLLGLLGAMGLVATSSATVVACGGDDTNETTTVALNTVLTGDSLYLGKDANLAIDQEGQSVHVLVHDALKAILTNDNMTEIDYVLNAEEVKGEATPVNYASVTVTPNADSTVYNGDAVTLKLVAEDAPVVPVITLDNATATAKVGENATVKVTNADKLGTITVKSSDETVATVAYADGTITITGVKAGNATITVSSDVEGVEDATIAVTVA